MRRIAVSTKCIETMMIPKLIIPFDHAVKCKESEYSCLVSKACIPKELRCDDKFDCELKEDELDCCKLNCFCNCSQILNLE